VTSFLLISIAAGLAALAGRLLLQGGKMGGLLFGISLPLAAFLGAFGARPLAPLAGEPGLHKSYGYLGSGACAECHPGASHSFSQTYHRTMTRRISELRSDEMPELPAKLETRGRIFEVARALFDQRRIELQGPSLHSIAEKLVALSDLPGSSLDLDLRVDAIFRDTPVERHDLVLVTGSHHYLAFWVEAGSGEELRQLPFVWLLRERVWVPREEAFLAPPGSLPHIARWNGSCVQCHSLAGMPREHNGRYDTQVAELGITCEACHGPGEAHADAMRSPLRRYAARNGFTPPGTDRSSTILNPLETSSAEASARCGQCHAYFAPEDPNEWWEHGFVRATAPSVASGSPRWPAPPALPGRVLLEPNRPEIAASVGLSRDLDSIFWPDGSVIVGGREYNGLIRSACYERGSNKSQLGCLDCHSMHNAAPNDQLKPDWQGRCIACHTGLSNGPTEHSRHPEIVGCGDCHMPKTSYALLSAIASHRITIPEPTSAAPPSACVLCHTARSSSWLSAGYGRLYGPNSASAEGPNESDAKLPLAVQFALSGNAVTRALLARALVAPLAVQLSGPAFPQAIVERLLADPYPAVRHIARRSLAELGSAKLGIAPSPLVLPPRPELLDELRKRRDDRDITISE
jgi:predicted CXXCH cytochrome family protein